MSAPENDRRIDYIEFPAADIGASKRFYGDVFGWKFTDWGDAYSSFEDGRLAGGLRAVDEATLGAGPGGALVVIYAVDLEAVLGDVRDAGGEISVEPFEFPGGRRFHFLDPAGIEVAVWSDR